MGSAKIVLLLFSIFLGQMVLPLSLKAQEFTEIRDAFQKSYIQEATGDFSAAITAASSVIGPIIPPSIPVIIYALIVTGVSVPGMFLGGVIPGILLAIFLSVYVMVFAGHYQKVEPEKADRSNASILVQGIIPLLMPVFVVGTILFGVVTPTEINMALDKGLNVLKFFPAEVMGGAKVLKAIGGPYQGVKFIPTGGIGPGNLADYLSLPLVHACGGSWLTPKAAIEAGDYGAVTCLAAEAVEIATAGKN